MASPSSHGDDDLRGAQQTVDGGDSNGGSDMDDYAKDPDFVPGGGGKSKTDDKTSQKKKKTMPAAVDPTKKRAAGEDKKQTLLLLPCCCSCWLPLERLLVLLAEVHCAATPHVLVEVAIEAAALLPDPAA